MKKWLLKVTWLDCLFTVFGLLSVATGLEGRYIQATLWSLGMVLLFIFRELAELRIELRQRNCQTHREGCTHGH